jgi:hypothetical protein
LAELTNMAQTNFTPISLYYSTTAAAVPTAGNLVAGELAINTQDGKLFYKDAAGVVQTIASKDINSGVFPAGTVSAPSITFVGDTNTGIYSPAADTIAFTEGGVEAARFDSSGNLGLGTATPANKLDIYSATAVSSRLYSDATPSQIISRASTDTGAPQIQLYKYRGTQASPTVVASGDAIARLQFFGYDGAALRAAAEIRSEVDGTPGSSDMPGRLLFYTTADGSASLTERVRINNAGTVSIGNNSPVVFGSTKKGIQYASGGIIYGDSNNPRLEMLANSYFDGSAVVRIGTGGSASFTLFEDGTIGFGSNTTSGSAGAATTNTSVLSMSKGNSIALEGASSVAGTGITFPATQSASSDANTLDDYEEGTWTPTLTFGGASVSMTYSVQTGSYTKIGRVVYATCRIVLTNKGSSTGSAIITGLPFTSISGNTNYGSGIFGYVEAIANSARWSAQQMPVQDAGTSSLQLRYVLSTGSNDHNADSFTNTTDIIISVTYQAA